MAVRTDKVQVDVEIGGVKAGSTLKELRKNASDLNKEINALVPGTEAFAKKAEELRAVNSQMAEIREQVNGVKRSVEQNAESFVKFSEGIASAFAVAPLISFGEESENLAKVQAQSLQALAIAQAGKKIAEGAANAQTVIGITLDKAKLLGTQSLTLAQRALNAVMSANPMALLITTGVALVGVLTALYTRSEAVRSVIDAMITPIREAGEEVAKFLGIVESDAEKRIANLDKQKSKVEDTYGREIELLKARGATDEEVTRRQILMNNALIELQRKRVLEMAAIGQKERDEALERYRELIRQREDYKIALEVIERDQNEKALDEANKLADERRKAWEKSIQEEAALRDKSREQQLAAERNIRDLSISLIEDDFSRQRALLQAQAADKIKALVGTPEQIERQTALIQETLLNELEKVDQARAAAAAERDEKNLQDRLTKIDQEEEMARLQLASNYDKTVENEIAHAETLYEIKRNALEQKMLLLEDSGQKESLEYRKLAAEIVQIEADKNEKIRQAEAEAQAMRQKTFQVSSNLARDYLSTAIAVMQSDANARKKNFGIIKALATARVISDGIVEVQNYFAQYGFPLALAFTIPAAVRTGFALSQLDGIQPGGQFFEGGYTEKGHKYKPAGIVHAGEWVGPQDMVDHPVYGRVISWLEGERRTMRGYADGGMVGMAVSANLPAGSSQGDTSGRLLNDMMRIMQRGIRAYVVYDDQRSADDEIRDIESQATIYSAK